MSVSKPASGVTIQSLAGAHSRDIHALHEEFEQEVGADEEHRGDTTTAARLLGYCDAMFATIGTFLVLPIRNLHHMKDGETVQEYMNHQLYPFFLYFVGFYVVMTLWAANVTRFTIIKRLDDALVLMVFVSLCASAAFPFGLAIQAYYGSVSYLGILYICGFLVFIEIMEVAMIFYGFASPRLLHAGLQTNWHSVDRKMFRNNYCLKNVINIILLALACGLSVLHNGAVIIIICIYTLGPTVRKVYMYFKRRIYQRSKLQGCLFYATMNKGNIEKERVEVMSDAAMAIVACVLALDNVVEDFPHPSTIEDGNIMAAIEKMRPKTFAAIIAYFVVCNSWYVNHTIIQQFQTIDTVTLWLQKTFLAFTALSPLSAHMFVKYHKRKDQESNTATLYAASFIFAASLCNVCMLFWGYYYREEKLLEPWAKKEQRLKNKKACWYVKLKTVSVPIWLFLLMLSSLGDPGACYYMRIICGVAIPTTFIVIKIAFMCHVGKERKEKPKSDNDLDLAATTDFIDNILNGVAFENKALDEEEDPTTDANQNSEANDTQS